MATPPSTQTTNNILRNAMNKKNHNPFLYKVSGQSDIANTAGILGGGTTSRLPAYAPLDKLKGTFVFENDAPQGYDNQIYLPALA